MLATAADGWIWHAWEQSPRGPWSGWAPLEPGDPLAERLDALY